MAMSAGLPIDECANRPTFKLLPDSGYRILPDISNFAGDTAYPEHARAG